MGSQGRVARPPAPEPFLRTGAVAATSAVVVALSRRFRTIVAPAPRVRSAFTRRIRSGIARLSPRLSLSSLFALQRARSNRFCMQQVARTRQVGTLIMQFWPKLAFVSLSHRYDRGAGSVQLWPERAGRYGGAGRGACRSGSNWFEGTKGPSGERANLARTSFLALLAKVTCRNRPSERLGVQERFERAREGPLRARSRRTCTLERSFEPNLHVAFRKTGSKLVRAKVARLRVRSSRNWLDSNVHVSADAGIVAQGCWFLSACTCVDDRGRRPRASSSSFSVRTLSTRTLRCLRPPLPGTCSCGTCASSIDCMVWLRHKGCWRHVIASSHGWPRASSRCMCTSDARERRRLAGSINSRSEPAAEHEPAQLLLLLLEPVR